MVKLGPVTHTNEKGWHQMSAELVVVPYDGKSEQEIAEDLKARYTRAVGAVAALMADADKHGMMFQFAGVQRDQFGKFFVPPVGIVKVL